MEKLKICKYPHKTNIFLSKSKHNSPYQLLTKKLECLNVYFSLCSKNTGMLKKYIYIFNPQKDNNYVSVDRFWQILDPWIVSNAFL